MKRKILFLFMASVIAVLLVVSLMARDLKRPMLQQGQETVIDVLYGDSVYKVAEKLGNQKLLDYPIAWVWYSRIFGMAEKIKAGEYRVAPGMSSLALLDDMIKGNAIKYTLTFIEGWTTAQAIRELQKATGIVSTLDPDDNDIILKSVNAEEYYQYSEGLFYPDTYQYTKGTKDREILQKAYDRLIAELNNVWANRMPGLPYKTPYEVLIMASIIEKESGVHEERSQIAGVFIERLRRNMRLQTDPTVIYGMGDEYKGKIRRKDLLKPTPYNTYTIDGLPPSPIALVSRASLEAAVNPLLNGMIFFVAKGNGYHVFSRTLDEHDRAVREYQLKRKASYRSTPEPCDKTSCEKL